MFVFATVYDLYKDCVPKDTLTSSTSICRFGKTVARNVGEMRLTRATQSPIHRLIENSVLEVYDNVPALAACRYVFAV